MNINDMIDNSISEFHKFFTNRTGQIHYAKDLIEPIEYIVANNFGKDFCRGNIIKYVTRAGSKGDNKQAADDIFKAIHYCFLLHALVSETVVDTDGNSNTLHKIV